jgi:hypothetical protein
LLAKMIIRIPPWKCIVSQAYVHIVLKNISAL